MVLGRVVLVRSLSPSFGVLGWFQRETNLLAGRETPCQPLPKDLIEIWEVEALLLSCERLPLISERAHTL